LQFPLTGSPPIVKDVVKCLPRDMDNRSQVAKSFVNKWRYNRSRHEIKQWLGSLRKCPTVAVIERERATRQPKWKQGPQAILAMWEQDGLRSCRSTADHHPETSIQDLVRTQVWPGIVVQQQVRSGIGRGVIATKAFAKGAWVCSYVGELLRGRQVREFLEQAEVTEYCFEFHQDGTHYLVNSNDDNDTIGRLINHSSRHPNLKPVIVIVEGKPVVAFKAKVVIDLGDELLFDYGERSDGGERPDWLDPENCACTKYCRTPHMNKRPREDDDSDRIVKKHARF